MADRDRQNEEIEYDTERGEQRKDRFTDAGYILQSEAPEIRSSRFVAPSSEPVQEKKRRGISAGTVVALCLICGVLGGALGGLCVGWYLTRAAEREPVQEIIQPVQIDNMESRYGFPKAESAAERDGAGYVLGIVGETVNPGVAQYYDMSQGVYVWSVISDSCAERAGIRSGDIITAIGDSPISTITELGQAEQAVRPGESCVFRVCRGGEILALTVVFDL